MSYDGYLKAWVTDIHHLWNEGLGTQAIAEWIAIAVAGHPEKLQQSGRPWPPSWPIPTPSASMVRYVLERTRFDRIENRTENPRPYPSEQGWKAILPPPLAAAQGRWDRLRTMHAMLAAGLTPVQIGQRFGVSGTRVRQILYRPPTPIAPVEVYLAQIEADLQVLSRSRQLRRWATYRAPPEHMPELRMWLFA